MRHRLDVVRQEHRERPGHRAGRPQHRAVAREHVVDGQVSVPLDAGAALDRERRSAELALVGPERVEHRDVGQQRREQLVVHELVLEGALPGAAVHPFEGHLHRNQARTLAERARDRRGTVLLHGPDRLAERRDLEGRHQARQDGVDVGARQRELGGAEVVERMPEGVDAISVQVGDGAGRPHLEVAADQGHADRVTFAKGRGGHQHAIRGACRGAGDLRDETGFAERSGQQIHGGGFEAAHRQGRRDGPEHRPELGACRRRQTDRLHVRRPLAEGGEARIRPAEGGRQVLGCDRELEPGLPGGRATWQHRRVLHLGDRRDAGNRLLRKRSDRVRHGPDEPSLHIDGTAAHALSNA